MTMQDVVDNFALKCISIEKGLPCKETTIDILECELRDAKFLQKLAGATKGVTFENPKGARWWLAFHQGALVGSVCLTMIGSKARCKSDFVLASMRGRGIYSVLFNTRLERIANNFIPEATCFSTQFSRPMFLKTGFKIIRGVATDDIVFMSKIM